MLFVKRDVVTVYKQTILGPLWYLIQPLFTALTFTLIFNKVANIETGTVPPFLFNLAGVSIWNYFNTCLRSEEHTSELQSRENLVCRLLLEKKNKLHYSYCQD